MRPNIGYRIMHPLLSQLRIRSERAEGDGDIDREARGAPSPLSGQFRNDVNERNGLEYFGCIKYFRLHRQLEALQRVLSVEYLSEFSGYYVNSRYMERKDLLKQRITSALIQQIYSRNIYGQFSLLK
ncbi:hypothetical protein ALC62_00508 [Cyphomyrmex costatus]|uniref:Uncharacterized protein n=1 Tax=Cyphomyrmex costatus TaxID=456900 RepID=A0A195D7U3_9HYME|nr:hypothetical protein ALC62_00508 [Cyphomyrmex costatus]